MKDFIEVVDKEKQCLVIIPVDRSMVFKIPFAWTKGIFLFFPDASVIEAQESIACVAENKYGKDAEDKVDKMGDQKAEKISRHAIPGQEKKQ